MKIGRCLLSGMIWLCAGTAGALELDLPSNARETASLNSKLDGYFAPTDVFKEGGLTGVQVEGEVRRSAFRIGTSGLTPLQVLRPLRAQLTEAGYEIVLDCAAVQCGGFDFRFATETVPAPAMHISLRNFHFLTAVIGDTASPQRVVTLLVSTSGAAAHLQIIQAGDLGDTPDQFTRTADLPRPDAQPVARPAEKPDPQPLALPAGRFALVGLEFGTGSGDLGEGPFEALQTVAERLAGNPDLTLALVGHTDSTGPLEVNITISRQRAQSVRQRLIDAYEVDPKRVTAHGVGFLAPVASNATEEGRQANRRVEAVFLP